jgi:hypothetical protein
LAAKANNADLATVATTGSYTDLINKPTPADIGAVSTAGLDVATASLVASNNSATTGALKTSFRPVLPKYNARRIALASAVSAPFDIVGLGDSLFVGQGATTKENRWPALGQGIVPTVITSVWLVRVKQSVATLAQVWEPAP